jgi:hypothetical protein
VNHGAALLPFILLSALATPLYAAGQLSADEVRQLFSGNTVEGEFREGTDVHVEPSGLSTFAAPFTTYFSADGTARSLRGKKKLRGKWRTSESGDHCVRWKGKAKEACAPIIREGKVYRKYMKRRGGRVKWVESYTKFTPGNPDNL